LPDNGLPKIGAFRTIGGAFITEFTKLASQGRCPQFRARLTSES